MDRYSVAQTVGLYEVNYERLINLFPRLRDTEGSCVLMVDSGNRIRLDIIENNRYTKIIQLAHDIETESKWVSQPTMRLRVYHDAKVVEVIAYQQQYRFKSRYNYPNEKMLCRHEKRIVNLFLGEWLEHCLSNWQEHPSPARVTSLP